MPMITSRIQFLSMIKNDVGLELGAIEVSREFQAAATLRRPFGQNDDGEDEKLMFRHEELMSNESVVCGCE